MKKGNPIALLPIGVFLVLYLGLELLFEYGLHIPMGFYNIPIVIAFLVSILVACLQNRAVPFEEKLVIMGQGVGDKNIITMLLIFLTAGAFVGVVGRSSAQSVAYFMLDIIPARFAVAVLFVVACFVSTAMGTSVGTITLIMPIALEVAQASGFDTALCTGSVVGGAMFGDNLSFISDTTIAACNGQGCAMRDKFKGNFWIALPAAIATLVLILLLTMGHDTAPIDESYDLVQIIPYVLVLAGGVAGINVFIVLLTGIVSGAVIMLLTGQVEATALLASMGNGAAGMFETSMVAILVAAMCALIRVYGGFDALLCFIRKVFRGEKRRPVGHGSAGRRHGHRHRQQHRRHRHGKPHCQGNERGLRHLPLPHGLPAGHLLLHFSGHYPLRCADAGRHLGGSGNGLCPVGVLHHAVSVLSVSAAGQLPDCDFPGKG